MAGLGLLLISGCNLDSVLDPSGDGSSSTTTENATTEPAGSSVDGTSSTGSATGDGSADSTGATLPPSSCAGRSVRVAAFNVETLGAYGSETYDALSAVIGRIDADVICLEEVQYYESAALSALADDNGYVALVQADRSPAIGGDHINACMSRFGLDLVGSYTGSELSSDPQANDVGRDILVVQVDLADGGGDACRLGVVSLHLKSGQVDLDWYRRQVEAQRVAQAVALYRDAFPGDAMVIMGDFNENIGDPALGTVYSEVPAGLPPSYQTGSDIEFPLTYQPFITFQNLGFSIAPATQEDSDRDATWGDSVRLDYVLQAGAPVEGAVVYSSCRDDGVDDPPAGQWLPLAGTPVACGQSEAASDHFPVVADLVLP